MLGLYATPQEVSDRRQSKALVTLVALAAILVGLGVLLLVGYNWEAMPAALKVAVVFAAVVGGARGRAAGAIPAGAARGLGGGLPVRLPALRGGDLADRPDLPHQRRQRRRVLVVGAGGLAVRPGARDPGAAHAARRAAGGLGRVRGVRVATALGSWLFGRLPGVRTAAYSLLPMAAPGFAWAYRKRSAGAVALYVPLVAWWVILQPFAWRFEVNPVYFIGAVGGLLLLAAEAHRDGSPMAIPYRFYGAALIAGALVPLSYYGFNKHVDAGRRRPRRCRRST